MEEHSISFLVPAYNEKDSVKELYTQIIHAVNKLFAQRGGVKAYNIWFIDDGSVDGTKNEIKNLMKVDKKVHLIVMRKNFGKSAALQAGFRHVDGDVIFTLDADLQDDPSEIPRFIEKLDEGYDLVVGWKYNRLDPLEKRLPSKLFNKVTAKFSGIELHDFDCGYKCFRREVVEALDVYGELHRYIPVLAFRKGFAITEIVVNHRKREHGLSKYGCERYMRGFLDSLTTMFLLKYYDRPMYLFGRIGIITGLAGFFICLFLTILWFYGNAIGTRPLLTLGVLLIIVGGQSIAAGFVCNLIVDKNFRNSYDESHIKEIINEGD